VAIRDLFTRRHDTVLLALMLYILIIILFMHFGVPMRLAHWTGFSRVYALMANIGLGVASTFALCRYLSRDCAAQPAFWSGVLVFSGLAALFIALLNITNDMIGHFVDVGSVVAAGAFFGLVFLCLWKRRVTTCAILMFTPLIYANALVNPIVHGLSGLTRGQVFRWLAEVNHTRPGGKWIVVGRSNRCGPIAHLIKATGADVLGGTRCNPDAAMIRALDPNGRYADVYNRHAAISFAPATGSELSFELTFVNSYRVMLPLDAAIFDRLNVAYVLEVDLPKAQGRIDGFDVIGEREDLRLLERSLRAPQ